MRLSVFSVGTLCLSFTATTFFSCGNASNTNVIQVEDIILKTRMNPEPAGLNPLTVNDQNKTIINSYVAYPPIGIDLEKLDWTPVLAKAMPVLENLPDGKQKVTIELREEATWDNGSPITGEDVLFSLKLALIPSIKQGPVRGFYRDIEDLQIDPENPKKYSVIFAQPYMLSATIAGDMSIFPKYYFDPEGKLDNVRIKDLHDQGDQYITDSSVVAFSEWFSSEKFNRDTIIGCGPYRFVSWESGKRITLERKKDWWGDNVNETTHYFKAYPKTLVFEFIKDEVAAVTALKAGELDFMYSIDPMTFTQDIVSLPDFETYAPAQLGYESVGISMHREPLTDVKTRKALAHLVDIERILNSVYYGLGERITTYIPSKKTDWINPDLLPYDFDMQKAKSMLSEAGWADTDGNGILDKAVNGRKKEFVIDLMYNAGNIRREKIAILYAEDLQKAGIKANIQVYEIPVMVDKLRKHDFDIYIGGFIQSVIETDPFQLWHTESANSGTNFPGFGNAVSDSLIDTYKLEMDVNKRKGILKKLQQMINEEVPVVFICTGKERIALHKKYTGLTISDQRPGFWLGTVKSAPTP